MAIKRDSYLDFLRFIGLSAIILVHINCPYIIQQFRCFDVPLMLFVSGLAFSGKQIDEFGDFVKHRVKRLVIPVYIFLTGLFLVSWLLFAIGFIQNPVPYKKMIGSYLLLFFGSIGYVWVIKVFLLIMLVTPALLHLGKRKKQYLWLVIIILLGCLEISGQLLPLLYDKSKIVYYAYFETIPFLLAYTVPFLIGMQVRYSEKTGWWALGATAVLVISFFVLYNQTGHILPISPIYKYPPRPIFIIYGITASLILWYCKRFIKVLADFRPFTFIGSNTIWIYLWHIPFVDYVNNNIESALLRFIVVYGGALVIFFIQYKLVLLRCPQKDSFGRKYLIG